MKDVISMYITMRKLWIQNSSGSIERCTFVFQCFINSVVEIDVSSSGDWVLTRNLLMISTAFPHFGQHTKTKVEFSNWRTLNTERNRIKYIMYLLANKFLWGKFVFVFFEGVHDSFTWWDFVKVFFHNTWVE